MQPIPPSAEEAPVRAIEELEAVFRQSEKPRVEFRVGAEAEKFGVDSVSLAPLPYSGPRSILSIFDRLRERHGWQSVSESEGSPIIALTRGQSSITLEPGAQLELSGAPWSDVHAIRAEFEDHFRELHGLSRELNLTWLSLGFHPLAHPSDLPWVPKERYAIMKQYLPSRGTRGRDMMQRTATVQANFDYENEEDAMRKMSVVLRLSPVFQGMFACAPFKEGQVSELHSERLDVWCNMDPERSGLMPRLWASKRPRYRDYIEWALDAGMFFIKRGPRIVLNTGQTFRSFLEHGFEGQRATQGDWVRHLATLFPDVRLKSTLEVRTCDALPWDLTLSVPALFTGLLYDERALEEAESLAQGVTLEAAQACRAEVARVGLGGRLGTKPVRSFAERLIDIASGGLGRRQRSNAAGEDEAVYLRPLARLVARGLSPSDALRGDREVGSPIDVAALRSVQVATGRVEEEALSLV
jgi:glutamate--cysteine ligase